MSAVASILLAPVARRTRRELGYVLVTLLPAVPAFVLAVVGVVAAALSLVIAGLPLPLLVLALAGARPGVGVFRAAAGSILGWPLRPAAPLAAGRPLRWVLELLRDGAAWRALLYCLVKLPLTAVAAYLGVVGVVAGSVALTAPVWWWVSSGAPAFLDVDGWPATWLLAAQGAVVLLAFPWLVRLLVAVDRVLAVALLTPTGDQERIAVLEVGRATLSADATATLRRIERDLHDGTQARLVSIALVLARIEPQLADPAARALVETARELATEGLAELREIIRGMHPPALDDGLPTAMATLASRSPVPTEFLDNLRSRPSEAAASTLYFTAAELLSNVARHARATHARLVLDETTDAIAVTVGDNGCGGAAVSSSGSGLVGLRRRAAALDGSLRVSSPDGGPTVVSMTLPKG
jgi:signal transduction histidine kinase